MTMMIRINPITRALGIFVALSLFLGASVGQNASAAPTLTYTLDQSNTFADGVNYGTVAIEFNYGGNANVARFTVTSNDSAYTSLLGNYGIQSFGFNSKDSNVQIVVASLPTGWSVDSNSNQDGFGQFQLIADTTGQFRVNPLEFNVTSTSAIALDNFEKLSTGTAGQGNVFFAAHITDITMSGFTQTSHWIGGSGNGNGNGDSHIIPEPSTIAMALTALVPLGIAGVRRYRRRPE